MRWAVGEGLPGHCLPERGARPQLLQILVAWLDTWLGFGTTVWPDYAAP